MEKKLPVKYGLLPILDFDSVIGRLCIKNVRVVGYAVSKCYISSEEIRYNGDGTKSHKYCVIFPYSEVYLDPRVKPIVNNLEQGDYRIDVIHEVYDDYASAKIACIKKNKEILDDVNINLANYKEAVDTKISSVELNSKVLMKK